MPSYNCAVSMQINRKCCPTFDPKIIFGLFNLMTCTFASFGFLINRLFRPRFAHLNFIYSDILCIFCEKIQFKYAFDLNFTFVENHKLFQPKFNFIDLITNFRYYVFDLSLHCQQNPFRKSFFFFNLIYELQNNVGNW